MDTSGFKHTPKTKTALITAIREEIKRQGSRADLNCIDTSAITNMRELFNKFKSFDGDISEWDVSNVKDMTDMFRDSDFRGDISGWNVDNVEYFFPMFVYCRIAEDHKPARFRRNRPAEAPVLEGKLSYMDASFSLSGDGVCIVSGDLSENHGYSIWGGCEVAKLPVKHLVFTEGVTEIGDYTFYEWDSIEELTLPSSLTRIGKDAFGRCRNIKRINFSEGLQEIGSSAFGSCPVNKLDLPKTLTKIGGYAFSGFDQLIELNLPDSIVSIGTRAFRDCPSLRSVKLPAHLKVIPESMFSQCKALEQVQMPEDLERIEGYAFLDCPNIKSVTLPNSVNYIADDAFESEEFDEGGLHYSITNYVTNVNDCAVSADEWDGELDIPSSVSYEGRTFVVNSLDFHNCKRLTAVRIPDTFSTIPDCAFADCKSLREVEIPSSVSTIGAEAFRGCEGLKSIELPDAVTEIAEGLFNGCWRLRKVQFGPNVTTIGEIAFEGCEFLQHLPLPDSVQRIERSAFEGCKNLVDLGQPSSLEFVGLYALDKTAMKLMQDGPIYVGSALCGYSGEMPEHSCLVVREGTTAVAEGAFRGYGHLESVIIPESLKNIGYDAFPKSTRVCAAADSASVITKDTVILGREKKRRVVLVEKPQNKSPWKLYGAIVPAEPDVDARKIVKDLLFEAFRDTARYLDLTDWSGDSYSPAEEMEYSSQRFAVVDLPEGAAPQTQTFDGKTYLTDEAYYNSLLSGGVQWEPLVKD